MITTPNGTKVELKEYITGREAREIQNIVLSGMKISENIESIDPTVIAQSQDKAIEIVVVSIDGETEGVLDKVLDLPRDDFDFVKEAIDEVTNGGDEEKKTK